MVTTDHDTIAADTPEAHRYNSVRRWLGIADSALGFVLLLVRFRIIRSPFFFTS